MDPQTLGFWSDIATIFMVLMALIVVLVYGAVLGVGWWFLRKGRKKLSMPFLYAQVYTLKAQRVTMQVTDVIAAIPATIAATGEGIKTATRVLVRGHKGQAN